MIRVGFVALVILASLWTFIECLQTPAAKTIGLPKWLWLIVIAVLPVIGPAGWFLIGRPNAILSRDPEPPRLPGPDDDPDFLRRLRGGS